MAIITVALGAIEFAVKNKWLNKLFGRKLLHFTAICTCAWVIQHFENRLLLAVVFLLFFFILLGVIRKGWMQVNQYKTYGIAFFPLAFSVLLFIPFFSNYIIVYAVLILGISDALAGICGEYFGKQKIIFLAEPKSWIGFTALYFSAFLITLFYFNNFSGQGILFCVALALLPALTELFSYRGSDNFTLPLFTAAWAVLLLTVPATTIPLLLSAALLFTALSVFAVRKKWLNTSGATAACWMALLLFVCGGFIAFIAPGIFLITGSLLSKINKPQKEKAGRNALQVFANGITGTVFMILYGILKDDIYLITAIVSFCISMADSCSSETGFYFKGATHDILSLKKLPPGVSGGVSATGTLAGWVGAVILSFITGFIYDFSFGIFIFIALAGFTGMLADSVLGSWLQIKFTTAAGVITDDATPGAKKLKGYSWCTNDAINIISNLLMTALFFYLLKQIN